MRGRSPLVAAIAVVLAVLVATAPAAGTHTAVVSIHTTDADFNSATTLTDVTVSGSGTSAGVVLESERDGSTATRPSDSNSASVSSENGIIINPNRDLSGIDVTISSNVISASTVYLRQNDGTLIDSTSISGGTVSFSATLNSGTRYIVSVDDGGDSYTEGFTSASYPYTSQDVDIVDGYFDGSTDSDFAYNIKDVTARFQPQSGTYVSSSHTWGDATTGFTDLSLSNAEATVTWQGSNGGSWTDLSTTTYTSSGNKSVSLSSGFSEYRVNVTLDRTSSSFTAELHDEGIMAETSEPVVDNTNAGPQSGSLNNENVLLSIPVSDEDFDDGDSATVDFWVDGSLAGSKTISSNQTVSFEATGLSDGSHTWSVNATDGHDHETQSQQFSFEVKHYAPELSGGSPDGVTLNDENVEFTMQVDDADFDETSGDEVQVELYVDGALAGTKNATTNGTVGITATGLSDGSHTWHMEAVDEYGNQATGTSKSVTIDHRPPVVDSLSPDGQTFNDEDVALSFNISDYDYLETSGDSVAVDLYVNGTVVNSWSGVAANQTLSYTVQGMGDGSHNWHVEATDEYGLSTTSTTATFTVVHFPPSFDNASASPSGGEAIDGLPTFEINGSDADFGGPGDVVTLEWYRNGALLGSTTETSNGTWTFTPSGSVSGTNTWHVEAADDYGHSATSDTFNYGTPSQFCLFQANEPSTKVTDATIEMRFFGTDGTTVVEKSTSTGCVDMGGLPATQEFIVVMRADGYADRRVLIDSLFDQQEGYLLNSTEHTTVFNRFELEDRTGQYPPAETTFFIDRALTKDFNGDGTNETQFTRIAGDGFGSQNRFPVILENGVQYRLRIDSNGNTRILGRYLAAEEGTVTLTVGSVTFERVNGSTYTFEMETDDEANELVVRYYDPANSTTNFEVVVHERGNTSNELINETVAGPVGVVKIKQPLTENETDTAWVANWSADYNGTQIGDSTLAGGNAVILPMDPRWLGSIALLFLTIVGTLGGNHQATTFTIIMVATAGMLMMFQFVDIPVPLYATAGLIAIGGRIRDTEGR